MLTINEHAPQANALTHVVRLHDYRWSPKQGKNSPPRGSQLFSNHSLNLEGEQYEYNH